MRWKVAKGFASFGAAGMVALAVLGGSARAEGTTTSEDRSEPAGEAWADMSSPTSEADSRQAPKATVRDVQVLAMRPKSATRKPPPPADVAPPEQASPAPGKIPPVEEDSGTEDVKKDAPKDPEDIKKPTPRKETADKQEASKKTPSAAPGTLRIVPEASAPARIPLSAEMAALRDRVRAVLAQHFREPLCTNDNSPGQILKFCLAYGCDTEIRYGNSAGSAMSGIGALCYGYPCAGFHLLAVDDRRVLARVGYAFQESPGELLAVLAQSAVPETYEMRIGQWRGTVASLVESEKLTCLSGGDLSQKLIGLSHYLPDGATWKNARGDAWSLERLMREELNRTPDSGGVDATNHVSGLAYALDRRARTGKSPDGQYERAQKFLAEYQTFALSLQNSDGSWNPGFFAAKGPSRDVAGSLRATGCILEWLVASLPVSRLQDRQIVRSLAFVTGVFESYYSQASLGNSSSREIDGVMHALHALKIYDRRVFKQAEPEKPEKREKPEKADAPETQAARDRGAVR